MGFALIAWQHLGVCGACGDMRYYKSIGRKDLDEIAWENILLEKIREFADWVEKRVAQLAGASDAAVREASSTTSLAAAQHPATDHGPRTTD
jgi:hypothetical protein